MQLLAHSLAWLASLLLAPLALAVALARPSWRRGLSERILSPGRRRDRPVWVHTASVGEAAAAESLVEALEARDLPVHLTSQTWTGRTRLAELHPGLAPRLAPIDHPGCTRRALRKLAPRALVLVEAEIWPSLVAQAERLGVPVIMVSGRISPRSFRRRRELDLFGLSRRSFERLSAVGARSDRDAERFIALGCDPARVSVTGDLKWAKPPAQGAGGTRDVRAAVAPELTAWMSRGPTVVLGSTHAGETDELLRAVDVVRTARRDVQWLWAPRHTDEVDELLRRLAGAELAAERRSALAAQRRATAEVLVLDTLGELQAAWPQGLLAVVGGSFDDTGGHDLLEPVHAGRPVLFGPRVDSVAETARLLVAARAAVQVSDGLTLGREILRLLDATAERAELVGRGTALVERSRSALESNLRLVLDHARPDGVTGARGRLPRAGSHARAGDPVPTKPRGIYAREFGARNPIPGALLRAAAWVYACGARIDRAASERRLRTTHALPCTVVSVGGLLVGGSGKTPAAAWIARALRAHGQRTVLVTRGHGVRLEARVVVASHGAGPCLGPDRVGDEAVVLARRAPGVPVLVSRDRHAAGLRAVSEFGCEVLVLDDGFQHHRLRRDLDLVCLDGRVGLGNTRVLPAGPLREPLSALGRADALLVVDGPLDDVDEARIEDVAPHARRFTARRVPRRWVRWGNGEVRPPDGLEGRSVGLLVGLAEPSGFVAELARLGLEVVTARVHPDHHAHRAREIARLGDAVKIWVTSEKDAVKIDPAWLGAGVELWVLEIELVPDRPEALVRYLCARCESKSAAPSGDAPARVPVPAASS